MSDAVAVISTLIYLGTAIWVGFDAHGRDWSGDRFADRWWKWVLGCLLLWIVVLPIYSRHRTRESAGEVATTVENARHSPTDEKRQPALFWWGVASAGAMVIGAFGPWATALASSVTGTNGGNDGWILVVLATLGFLCVLEEHRTRSLALLSVVAGLAGIVITLYDRGKLENVIGDGAALGSLARVGWGLELALAASVSLAVHGAVVSARKAVLPRRRRPTQPAVVVTPAPGLSPPSQRLREFYRAIKVFILGLAASVSLAVHGAVVTAWRATAVRREPTQPAVDVTPAPDLTPPNPRLREFYRAIKAFILGLAASVSLAVHGAVVSARKAVLPRAEVAERERRMSAFVHGSTGHFWRTWQRRLLHLRPWLIGVSLFLVCGWLIGSMG